MRALAPLRRSLLPALSAGALLMSVPVSAQPLFGPPPGGTTTACEWDGGAEIRKTQPASGFEWYGLKLLDLANYQQCWNGFKPDQKNGYPMPGVKTDFVALGTGAAIVQSNSFTPFQLKSLTVGSGWTDGINLTFKGYLDSWNNPIVRDPIRLDASKGQMEWALDIGPIRWFTLDVDWGAKPAWNGVGTPPEWTGDPFNSRPLQRDYEIDKKLALTGSPYQTYFVSGLKTVDVTTVPEPGTWALMAVGLIGLGLAPRRRPKN